MSAMASHLKLHCLFNSLFKLIHVSKKSSNLYISGPMCWESTWTRTLQWRHNGRDGVSNHQSHDFLLNCLFRPRLKKTSKLRDTVLCGGNSPVTCEFPAQMASNAKNVSIGWRHHVSPTKRGSSIECLPTPWYHHNKSDLPLQPFDMRPQRMP